VSTYDAKGTTAGGNAPWMLQSKALHANGAVLTKPKLLAIWNAPVMLEETSPINRPHKIEVCCIRTIGILQEEPLDCLPDLSTCITTNPLDSLTSKV
jgi:hypothetical protein